MSRTDLPLSDFADLRDTYTAVPTRVDGAHAHDNRQRERHIIQSLIAVGTGGVTGTGGTGSG